MKLLTILIINTCIISVHGFFYTLLPLVVLKHNNTGFKVYCPWNQHTDTNLSCKVHNDVMGYYPLSSDNNNDLDVKKFLNPSLQKPFAKDHCKELKTNWSTKSTTDVCKNFSFCFNVGDDKSVCSCQAGFFGDPYVGCHQHCFTDDDCSSPLAVCKDSTTKGELRRCVCKENYQGDGVMCYKNPCGDDRRAKCKDKNNTICVPTGPGDQDFKCVCPTGYYVNHEDKCVEEVTIQKNKVLTLVGKNVPDGSRLELGDCLTFVLNDGSKSIFYHKNSGDSIYVKRAIKNENQFSVFFIITDEVTAFSAVKDQGFGLNKLYSMSSTFTGCKFGRVRVYDPEGREFNDEYFDTVEQPLTPGSQPGQVPVAGSLQPEAAKTEATKPTATKTEATRPVASKPEATKTDPGKQSPSSPNSGSGQGTDTGAEDETENQETQRKVEKPKVKPVVEVYVRDLKPEELAGGLSAGVKAAEALRTQTEAVTAGVSEVQTQARTEPGAEGSTVESTSVLETEKSLLPVKEL